MPNDRGGSVARRSRLPAPRPSVVALSGRPSRAEAEAAVRTLIRWAGDDPSREGLVDTPSRVVRAYEEFFAGYESEPAEILRRTFEETDGYDEMVVLKDIRFESHCEHHMVPILGKAHVAYIPNGRVVGLSKLNRVVDFFARRPQVQERLTMQIAEELKNVLKTDDVAVYIDARHMCVQARGVEHHGASTITAEYSGKFLNENTKQEFLMAINSKMPD